MAACLAAVRDKTQRWAWRVAWTVRQLLAPVLDRPIQSAVASCVAQPGRSSRFGAGETRWRRRFEKSGTAAAGGTRRCPRRRVRRIPRMCFTAAKMTAIASTVAWMTAPDRSPVRSASGAGAEIEAIEPVNVHTRFIGMVRKCTCRCCYTVPGWVKQKLPTLVFACAPL